MIEQILIAFFSACINRIVTTFKVLDGLKFYLILAFVTVLSLSIVFKDTIEIAVRGKMFSPTDFRECRNPYDLESAMNGIAKRDTNIISYTVFLYEPKNRSFYKKLILTNSKPTRDAPSLQTEYLKDQPSINAALDADGYYLIDDIELRKPDLKTLKDLGITSALYYRLSSSNTPVGEIALQFKEKPTAKELDLLLKELSPLLYLYVI